MFVKHQKELASYYVAKECVGIPPGWHNVSKRDALKNLREQYRIEEPEEEGETTYCTIMGLNPWQGLPLPFYYFPFLD